MLLLLINLVFVLVPFTYAAAVLNLAWSIPSRANSIDYPVHICPNYRDPGQKSHAVATLLQTPQLHGKKCTTKVALICVGLFTACSIECTNAIWEGLLNPITDTACAACMGSGGVVCKECWKKKKSLEGFCRAVKGNAVEAKCVAPLCQKLLRSN